MRTIQMLSMPVVLALAASCGKHQDSSLNASSASRVDEVKVESALPADRLAKLKAALPKVAFPKLQQVLQSSQTFWYDHETMTPTYQAAIKQSPPYGANSNNRWFDAIAGSVQPTARNFYDTQKKRWRFPFGTTAGTDNSPNFQSFNFLWLPAKDGKLLPVSTYTTNNAAAGSGFTLNSWGWRYPNGAMVGELIFVTTPEGDLLPSEVRLRTRYANGWAINVFRPFPTAASLAKAVKTKRPDYANSSSLKALMAQLETSGSLTAKGLHAPQLPNTFDQDGALDILPEFGDDALVKELLTQTVFVSSYDMTWKSGDGLQTYAASTSASLSIVPKNYEGGIFAVNEDSCMRCHKEAGKGLTTFSQGFSDIVLYGEMWGRDGIFSFHPFDEAKYPSFWSSGTTDNRRQNPKLKAQGIIADFNAQTDKAPLYPTSEIGLGKGNLTGAVPAGTGSGTTPAGAANGGTDTAETPPKVDNKPSSTNTNPKIVEFHIPAGTGSGEWNQKSQPLLVKAGQTIRIISDDETSHVHHTNYDICPHGPIGNPIRKGKFHDCVVEPSVAPGLYLTWDHFLGSPNNARFWIKVQ